MGNINEKKFGWSKKEWLELYISAKFSKGMFRKVMWLLYMFNYLHFAVLVTWTSNEKVMLFNLLLLFCWCPKVLGCFLWNQQKLSPLRTHESHCFLLQAFGLYCSQLYSWKLLNSNLLWLGYSWSPDKTSI